MSSMKITTTSGLTKMKVIITISTMIEEWLIMRCYQ